MTIVLRTGHRKIKIRKKIAIRGKAAKIICISGMPDSNWQPPAPKAGTLTNCANPRKFERKNFNPV